MKKFIKNIPGQIASTFAIMVVCFTAISFSKGIETIPTTRLAELLVLAIIGGIWMEFAFGTCIIKKLSDVKRICLFIVPFALVTFLCAVIFQWITELNVVGTHIKFIGIFFVCWLISIIIFEIEHSIRGKKYTKKLREYQNRGKNNE